jgi:hypothetical protein
MQLHLVEEAAMDRDFSRAKVRIIQKAWRMKVARIRLVRLPVRVVKVQAIVRSRLARLRYREMVRSIILIQGGIRRKLDTRQYHQLKAKKLLELTLELGVRCRWSAVAIQLWWRGLVESRKKQAAMVIERFFVRILGDIAEEVVRLTSPVTKSGTVRNAIVDLERSLSPSTSTDLSMQSLQSPQRRLRFCWALLCLCRCRKHSLLRRRCHQA